MLPTEKFTQLAYIFTSDNYRKTWTSPHLVLLLYEGKP